MHSLKGEKGFTLIEVLVAAVLIGAIAVLIIPQFFKAKEMSKSTDLQTLCLEAVQAKLAEYKSGPSIQSDLSGQNISTGVAGNVSQGFVHAKYKYNMYYPEICGDVSHPLGVKEWIDQSRIIPAPNSNPCSTPVTFDSRYSSTASTSLGLRDQKTCQVNPYFRLYTQLQEINLSNKSQIGCPSPAVGNAYDFKKRGYGILVTVTAKTEIPSGSKLLNYDSSNADRLTCKGSIILTPVTVLARYVLDSDGATVYEVGNSANADETKRVRAFPSLEYINKKQILVSDDNATVYVLRDGNIVYRFTGCGGFNPPDCGAEATMTSYELHPSIDYLGMDTANSSLYGYFSDGTRYADLSFGATNSIDIGEIKNLPKGTERTKAAFSAGKLMKSFMVDNSCDVQGQSGYDCQTVYNAEMADNSSTNCDGAGSTNCWVPVPAATYDLRVIGITP
jgi:prepilin-type N-terminal cleavage/methylation domain-containing protein